MKTIRVTQVDFSDELSTALKWPKGRKKISLQRINRCLRFFVGGGHQIKVGLSPSKK